MPERKRRPLSVSVLLIGVALALFASPFTASWAGFRPPWFTPYLLWGGLIGLTAFMLGSDPDNDR
jgi:hypothetical protein